jgi:hypothetical protein
MTERILNAARRGDLTDVYQELLAIPKYRGRFENALGIRHAIPLVDGILQAFQTYWRSVLLKTVPAQDARRKLF